MHRFQTPARSAPVARSQQNASVGKTRLWHITCLNAGERYWLRMHHRSKSARRRCCAAADRRLPRDPRHSAHARRCVQARWSGLRDLPTGADSARGRAVPEARPRWHLSPTHHRLARYLVGINCSACAASASSNTSSLIQLQMTPMRVRRMQAMRASLAEAESLCDTLSRASGNFGARMLVPDSSRSEPTLLLGGRNLRTSRR